MKRIFVLILLLGVSQIMLGLKPFTPNLDGFSKETLLEAMSNSPVEFMSPEEQKVVFYMNLVRLEPQVFLNDILKPYVESQELNVNSYVKSLYRDLDKAQSVKPFDMKKDLYLVSKAHVKDIGDKGLTGHTGSKGKTFKKRVDHLFDTYLTVSENVGLGFEDPLSNVIGLLIDDGVKDLGHRKAIMSNEYNCVGVAMYTHRDFRFGCVMDFGQLVQ